jgi:hypothetical protein
VTAGTQLTAANEVQRHRHGPFRAESFDGIERRGDAGPFVGSPQETGFGQRLDIVMDAPVVPIEGLG